MAEPDRTPRTSTGLGPPAHSRPKPVESRWAVLVGINGYHQSLGRLPFCVPDAGLLRNTLVSEACAFGPDNVLLLCDDAPPDRRPTFGNLHSWLATWLARPGENDLVLLYFAGHGREIGGEAVLAPLDATLDSLPVTGVPVSHVRGLLDRCKAARKVLILDACHGGAGRDIAAMSGAFRTELAEGSGLYTIASCSPHQISHDWPQKRHGVFTYYLAEAIGRAAPAGPDGRVTLDAVYEWTHRKVCDWAAAQRIRQEPVRVCDVRGPITIATRRPAPTRAQPAPAESAGVSTGDSAADGKPAPAKLPEWTEWLDGRGPHNWLGWSLAAVPVWLLGAVLAVFLGAYTQSLARGAVVFLAMLGIPLIAWRGTFRAWRNRYRLHCAEVCRGAGDYLGGAGPAMAMGKWGVDRSAGGAVLAGLAGLAADHGDTTCARRLYRRGWRRWRSRHAKRGLKSLATVE